jgi:hypothetical protein
MREKEWSGFYHMEDGSDGTILTRDFRVYQDLYALCVYGVFYVFVRVYFNVCVCVCVCVCEPDRVGGRGSWRGGG